MSEDHEDFAKLPKGKDSDITGYIGECLVQLEIAKRLHTRVLKIPDEFDFDTDFITATGKRLQVKTIRQTRHIDNRRGRTPETLVWHFQERKSQKRYIPTVGIITTRIRRQSPRLADFYILVCLPRREYEPLAFFIIPSEALVTQNKGTAKKQLTSFAIYQADLGIGKGKQSRWVQYRDKWNQLETGPVA